MSNNNNIYEECYSLAHDFLTSIELTCNNDLPIKKEIKFICKYPSLLEYQSILKIQKWWDRMRAKLLALNQIKYQQCEDCGKWRKKYIYYNHKYYGKYNIDRENINIIQRLEEEVKLENNNELEIRECCSDYIDCSSFGRCCIKFVCRNNDCSYLLTCCNNITKPNENNFKDDDKYALIKCNHCNKENNVKLTWYGMTCKEYIEKYG